MLLNNYTIKINRLLKKKRNLKPWENLKRSDFEKKAYEYKQKIIKTIIEDIQDWYIKWKWILKNIEMKQVLYEIFEK